jgi:hypothetical protein
MVPLKMTWKKKCITLDKNRNADGTIDDINSESNSDDTTDADDKVLDQISEDINDAPSDIVDQGG